MPLPATSTLPARKPFELDRPELLRAASEDRLHEPYREPLIPGLAACREALLRAGADAAFLSGAGPTLAAISTGPDRGTRSGW